ncbi:MAG: hypothetical protein R3Y19_04980 [Rikenellaceae bacterium]
MKKKIAVCLIVSLFCSFALMGQPRQREQRIERDYDFEGSISREVLENYLRRSITFSLALGQNDSSMEESLRFLANTRPKFVGRAIGIWGSENKINDQRWLDDARSGFEQIHALDPTIVLQCAMFEIITSKVNEVAIPAWVFEEFDLPVETRNFRYEDMLLDAGRYSVRDFWNKDQSVPNIVKTETQMWFYFLAATYINLGIEAIHFGQVALMGSNDNANLDCFYSTVARIRSYASQNARRGYVIIDAHTPLGGIINDRRELLFDFHSFPIRAREIADRPKEAELMVNYLDAIYKNSMGGISPSGWECESLPYLVEIDNYGQAPRPGEAGQTWYIWGWDEITWFTNQPEYYRNYWLEYAWTWVRTTDPNGFLQMPGWRGRYRANTKSDACPNGSNQEQTIKMIWDRDDLL